jgi:triosephosphate isomerase
MAAAVSRRPLVSGNWKMHHDHIEALHTVRDLGLRIKPGDVSSLDVTVHPPFTDLRTVQSLIDGERLPLGLGAQHCYYEDRGAFTGEVSPQMLARLGVAYVLVGHSERRQIFDMTDEAVALTLRAVLRHEMTPILCVGETEELRDAGATSSHLEAQVRTALTGLAKEQVGAMVLAYEPIWAIGTGRAATVDDAQDACAFIRSVVAEMAGEPAARALRIQYGGSVKGANAGELVDAPDVDGLLVGGASLDAAGFVDIIRAVSDCYRSSAA